MFIGHFAVGFVTKRLAPETSLGWHVLAPCFLDVLFPIFVATGIEHTAIEPGYTAVTPLNLYDIPWSHSLVMSLLWSALFAGVFFALRKNARTAGLLGFGVFSHFILDFVTHRPEMQLYPGAPHTLGLNLWASVPGTLVAEFGLLAIGTFVYARASKPLSKGGTLSFAAFVGLLCVAYLGNVFGPPPPSVNVVVVGIFALLLVIPWAHAFDKRRTFAST
jgi:membrane-bound metal-dependent hydrolase YbcI (DUF457 family)